MVQTRVPGHASARRCSRLFDRRRSQARDHRSSHRPDRGHERRHGIETGGALKGGVERR